MEEHTSHEMRKKYMGAICGLDNTCLKHARRQRHRTSSSLYEDLHLLMLVIRRWPLRGCDTLPPSLINLPANNEDGDEMKREKMS